MNRIFGGRRFLPFEIANLKKLALFSAGMTALGMACGLLIVRFAL